MGGAMTLSSSRNVGRFLSDVSFIDGRVGVYSVKGASTLWVVVSRGMRFCVGGKGVLSPVHGTAFGVFPEMAGVASTRRPI